MEIEVQELTAEQNKKERLRVKCDVVGCDFNTGFVTHELAKNYWKVKHEFNLRKMQYENGKSFRDKEREDQE